MLTLTSSFLAILGVSASVARADDPFPAATPESQGLNPAALAKLADVVQGFVDHDEIVGAELLVIQSDHTVMHRAFGWKDRSDKVAMPLDTIFCVRSMTKPVVGTAVEMLIEESKLGLDDTAAHYLTSFDNPKSRSITVKQLLHHTSGLPLSSLLGSKPSDIHSVREVADLAGAHGPDFTPGDHFSYSDDGADTLGALVEVASGESLAKFVGERVLAPLGMEDAITFVAPDHSKRARIASNYSGSKGSWTRYWSPKDPAIFGCLLASQSLYCTPLDYARFLSLWKSRGTVNDKHLLKSITCKRALAPGTVTPFPSGFEGVETHYGELWELYVDKTSKTPSELYAFGHDGSDGTYAYVFPKLDLMVLYFTQSRAGLTGTEFEAVLQREIVDPRLHIDRKPAVQYAPAELDAVAGWYWDSDRKDVLAFTRKDDKLAVEIVGEAALELKPTSTRDRWTVTLSPDDEFVAERDKDGAVIALTGRNAVRRAEQRYPRWQAEPGLPSVDEVMKLRKHAVDWDKMDGLGAVRVQGKIEMPALKVSGTFVTLFQGLDRYRLELTTNRGLGRVGLDGPRAWTANSMVSGGKATDADEAMRARLVLSVPLHVVADWRKLYRELRVIAKVELDKRPAIVLRAEPEKGHARTLFVDAEKGLLLRERLIQNETGLGELGSTILYEDWRDVGGIELPWHFSVEHATPLLGTYESRWESAEAHVELPPDAFAMPANK
jgi:CubicO group peptidase (beta-lactamase class C family)